MVGALWIRNCVLVTSCLILVAVHTPAIQKRDRSLEMKISTNKSSICIESELIITIHITNRSKQNVVINSSKPWTNISFLTTKEPARADEAGHMYVISPDEKSHSLDTFLVLKPGQSYKTTKGVKLNKEIFTSDQEYEVSAIYLELQRQTVEGIVSWIGMVKSNKMNLRPINCGKSDQ